MPDDTPESTRETDGVTSAPNRRTILVATAGLLAVGAIVAGVAVGTARDAGGSSPSTSPGTTAPETPSASPSTAPPSTEPPAPTEQPAPSVAPLASPAPVGETGLTASIVDIQAVDGQAEGPGEVAGPAIRFAVRLVNGGSGVAALEGTVVTVDFGPDRTPALQLEEPGGVAFPASVEPGATATGVFIFTVPADQRGVTRITVDYAVDVAPLVFEGATPAS